MPSSTKWRVYVTAAFSSYCTIAEVQMRETGGGADQCTGGTASASSFFSGGYVAANGFDDNADSAWSSAAGGAPWWIQYDFPSAKSIVEFTLSASPSLAGEMAKSFVLQYWDGAAWVDTISRQNEATWAGGETRIYSAVPKTAWRLLFSAGVSGQLRTAIAEVEMRSAIGGADQCTGGTASASSVRSTDYVAANAFDNSATTQWRSTDSFPVWLAYAFGSVTEIAQYVIQAPATPLEPEAPRSFKLQYSDGLGGWVDADSRSGLAAWSAGEIRVFVVGEGQAAAARPQVFVCT